jgi:hypothetical protein
MIIDPQRRERLFLADERNSYIREEQEWGRIVEEARRRGWPLPVAGGVNTFRKSLSQGFDDQASSWNFPIDVADFSSDNFAGASSNRYVNAMFPLTNPFHILKSSDNYPSEQPAPTGGKLTVATATRAVGTGNTPIAFLVGCWLVHATGALAGYNGAAAITAVNIRVASTSGPAAGSVGPTTVATIAPGTVNIFEAVPIASPADRQVGFEGVLLATLASLYNGDILLSELVTSGALNIQGNIVAVMVEVG